MDCSYVTRNVFTILPLLVLLSITPLSSSFSPTDKVTKALVYQLCSTPSIYKHFCVAWLNSDPKTFTLDLHGLVGMVIQKTVLLGYKNLEMTKGLARTTNDPNLKIPYGSCVTDYELSIKALEGAKGFASSEDYVMNNVFASSLMFFVMIGSLHAQVADIKAICGKAKDPSFCSSYMKSNPKTSGADLPTLAKITFGSAQTSASGALTKVQSLVETETNPSLKKGYTSCVEQYKNAISNLNEAKQNLASGDGPGLNIKVSAAMEGSTTCQDDLANVKADPSAVKNSGDFQNICGIVLVISNMM